MPEDRLFNSLLSEPNYKDVMWWWWCWCTTEASRRDRVGCILDSHSVDYGLRPFNCPLHIFILILILCCFLVRIRQERYLFGFGQEILLFCLIRAFHNIKHSLEWTTSHIWVFFWSFSRSQSYDIQIMFGQFPRWPWSNITNVNYACSLL